MIKYPLAMLFTLHKPLNTYIYRGAILVHFFFCQMKLISYTVESLKKGQAPQHHTINIIVINNNIILFAKYKQMSCQHLCPQLRLILQLKRRTSVCFLVLPAVDIVVFSALIIMFILLYNEVHSIFYAFHQYNEPYIA